jgi:hypothetical protein
MAALLHDPCAVSVTCTETQPHLVLTDGREIIVPLERVPRLQQATRSVLDGLLTLLNIGSSQTLRAARFILYGAIVLLLAWTYIRTSQQG